MYLSKISATMRALALPTAITIPFACGSQTLDPVDQEDLNAMIRAGDIAGAFERAFHAGDELTEFSFTAEMGVGAYIGEGQLFTRFPRADLTGPMEWANHRPTREGGANATSCIACHSSPIANGAGDVALNAIVDPAHTGDPSLYLVRNTLHVFALALPQMLAEEMSLQLYAQRDDAIETACAEGEADVTLVANGISFGVLRVERVQETPCLTELDTSAVDGVDPDLVIRPFGWKGNQATIRGFTRGAAHNELGLQAVEIIGALDGDFDGVTEELSVGDLTALTMYMAALERPVTRLELAALGLDELSEEETTDIHQGEALFAEIGCASCHTPSMTLQSTVFREPSRTPGYFDVTFPDGSDPADHGLMAELALSFDITRDQPNNRLMTDEGEIAFGAVPVDDEGGAVVMWYSDLRRHDMGPGLSDPSDPLGIGASVFLTRSLAGVGSTGPWLHDGRATTLEAAILAHGGEAEQSRDAFSALDLTQQGQIRAFLENLVIYDSHGG